ncbi:ComEC/Rec2 family competence protein [Numidum massiliense]|uniref:ComEC/Rec2 family competence protein n=1 Tax=Numidum massiliense TaxID=1522315 RepID=UPI0006D54F6E|nr:ComEC/Rec2 family competence protein [Numidum massiliense]
MKHTFKKFLSISLVLALVFTFTISTFTASDVYAAKQKKMHVHFIDVGQGDSTLIKFPSGKTMLIDGGSKGKGKIVLSKLKKFKVKQIDILVATHPDAQHIGGLIPVLQSKTKVKKVYAPKVSHTTKTYKDFLRAVKKKKLKIATAKAGVKLNVGKGATATIVAPVKSYSKKDLNNWGTVIRVKHGKNTFLFTGDAETKSEKDMVKSVKKRPISATVLKVAHHGSKYSTSTAFLKKVKPKYAVISVAKKNAYKHPTKETLSRLKKAKVKKIYRTDQHRTITATSNGKTVSFKTKQ